VVHIRNGAPDVPVWLFSTAPPLAETARLCERVHVHPSPLALLLLAEVRLWRCWVAISAGTWTGGRGKWPLKLAPFLIPPFRALFLNRHGGFFPGTPASVFLHDRRIVRGAIHSGWNRLKDLSRGVCRSGPVTRVKDLARGSSLLLVATLLRWLGYPDRKLFRRLHGNAPLPVSEQAAAGGLVRFEMDRSRWNPQALERFLHSGDARWILFHGPAEDGHVADMLPLFEDGGTFAVSQQASYREWQPSLLPMAPFRELGPGEASQVMAPVSGVILVDRQKLAALGVPPSGLTATAWMLLFWKAAAAGWRSYATANGGGLRRQPDFPIHERAFILRVLSDPELKRLGPQEPDLARGNIAFAPALRPPSCRAKERLRVLLVSPFLPYPLSHGGAVRIYNLCRALAGRVDFTLVAMREQQDVVDYGRLHEIFPEAYIVDRDEPAATATHLPMQVREHQSRSLMALIGRLCRDSRPDLLQIEYTHMAGFREAAPELPAILVEHDLTFSLYRQLAEAAPSKRARREYERWLAFERRWLAAYDGVWTVSDHDRRTAILEGGRREELTFTVPNGVDITRFTPTECTEPSAEILYVGSFRHLPNILGFETLLREVMPRVWRRLPHARLRVVAGPGHEWFWQRLRRGAATPVLDPRVEVHGFIEDLRPFYAGAAAVVAPLAVSAGTNIKVLEAMACGKAVVAMPAGCAGLGLEDGCDAVVRGDWAGFADSVCGLVDDPGLRSRIGVRARRTTVERFSWAAVADSAHRSYLALRAVAGAVK
jgi:glycosyltransferase involved in cell wall biosynthesis